MNQHSKSLTYIYYWNVHYNYPIHLRCLIRFSQIHWHCTLCMPMQHKPFGHGSVFLSNFGIMFLQTSSHLVIYRCSKRAINAKIMSYLRVLLLFWRIFLFSEINSKVAIAHIICSTITQRPNLQAVPKKWQAMLNRDVFDSFVEKCNRIYNPRPFACVDETLLGFREPSSVSSTQANCPGL